MRFDALRIPQGLRVVLTADGASDVVEIAVHSETGEPGSMQVSRRLIDADGTTELVQGMIDGYSHPRLVP